MLGMAKIKSMLFKTVSDDEWRSFKVACAKADTPMTEAVAGFMSAVARGNITLEAGELVSGGRYVDISGSHRGSVDK